MRHTRARPPASARPPSPTTQDIRQGPAQLSPSCVSSFLRVPYFLARPFTHLRYTYVRLYIFFSTSFAVCFYSFTRSYNPSGCFHPLSLRHPAHSHPAILSQPNVAFTRTIFKRTTLMPPGDLDFRSIPCPLFCFTLGCFRFCDLSPSRFYHPLKA